MPMKRLPQALLHTVLSYLQRKTSIIGCLSRKTRPQTPLIVYLHGGSGRGDDINKLTQNGFCMWVSEGKFDDVPAYTVFPQLADKYKAGWSANQTGVQKLIENLVKTYKIDTDRISLVGHSMGGTGTLAVASALPA